MNTIIFPDNAFIQLKDDLLQSELETCAILFANCVSVPNRTRLLIGKILYPPENAYRKRNIIEVELKPEYIAQVTKQAKIAEQALIFVHTHPGKASPSLFSKTDDAGELALSNFLQQRIPNLPHSSLVLTQNGCRARILGSKEEVGVVQIGRSINVCFNPHLYCDDNTEFNRQVLAFGATGQAKLKKLKICIVGLGGTGSIIAQQLSYLGVENFLLIDPDNVENTNLNRLVGATFKDIGAPKVNTIERNLKAIRPTASVETNQGSIIDDSTASLLKEVDFIFCCTDSHGSRAVISQFAYQYFIPCIDMGVSITAHDGFTSHITGRVQMLSPGLSCLICSNLLDPDSVRRDLMTNYQRQADPYFLGDAQPEPAVISINSTVSSLAITMFLAAITGIPAQARYQIYNGISGKVRTIEAISDPSCIVCSKNGASGKGNKWPLPTRRA